MDLAVSVINKSKSLVPEDTKSLYLEYELNILNKIILFLSGYDTSPVFRINVDKELIYPIGFYPDVIQVSPEVKTSHVSPKAIKSLLTEIAHYGSAVHLLSKLNDALSYSYKGPDHKEIPPSLIVLVLEEPAVLNGCEHGASDSYDWYWNANFSGFCTAVSIIFNDWRLIMFNVQEEYFKTVYNKQGEWVLCPNFIRNLDELKSPILEVFETHQFTSNSKESRILDLYVNTLPFLKLMESLMNLVELFLNYLKTNSIDKSEIPNAMLTLLMMKIRISEMSNDKDNMKLWRFLLYYTFMGRKDYVLTLTTENMFSLFEESKAKAIQISENIRLLDKQSSEKRLNLICDNDLKINLLKICSIDTQSIEFKLISYLNYKFKNFITLGMGMTESLLKNKYNYNHYLFIFNSIALGQFVVNLFATKTMLKDKNVKSAFDKICISQSKMSSSLLSELLPEELDRILSNIKIYFIKDKYAIGIVEKGDLVLFERESMKMYSAIFNHILEFMRFKKRLEGLVNECKWRTNKNRSHPPSLILFLVIHFSNSLMTYYKLILDHFWNYLNRVNYGMTIEAIKRSHLGHLKILSVFLFVPGTSVLYFNEKARSLSESIGNIFKIAAQLTPTSVVRESSAGSDTCNKLKSHIDDIILILDKNLIDDFTNWDYWSIFSDEVNSVLPSACAKSALHTTLSLFKNLLSFSHTPV